MNDEPAPDELPESLDAAQAEHTELMEQIQQAQQQIQQAQQFIEAKARRGIFLEGVIKTMQRPNRQTRRTAAKKA